MDEIAKHIRAHPISSRFDLHKRFCKKFDLNWRWVDELSSRARNQLRKESNINQEEAKSIGLGDPNPIVSLKAERAFCAIHGYDSPTQTRVGSPDGSPLPSPVIAPTVIFEVGNKQSTDAD